MFYIIVIGVILAFFQAYNIIKFHALEKALDENNNSQNTFLNDRSIYMSWMQNVTDIKSDIKEIKEMLKHQNDFIITTINKSIDEKLSKWFNCYQ